MKLWLKILALIIVVASYSQGQVVTAIRYEGLKKTKPSYLNRFIAITVGQNLDTNLVAQSIQNLENTQYFVHVTATIDSANKETIVVFHCNERLTLLPIFNFGSVRDNYFFEIGLTDYHWLGKGGQFGGTYRYYDRHTFTVNQYIPYICGSQYGISWNAKKYSTIEPLFYNDTAVFYNYDNLSAELLGVYEFKQNHRLMAGGALFNEIYDKHPTRNDQTSLGPEHRNFTKYLLKVVHYYQQINYNYHYLDGFSNLTLVEGVKTLTESGLFKKVFNETRYFKRVGGRGNFAVRFKVGLATNNTSPFAPFVLDSYMNIRGVGNRVDRGTGQVVLNTEYRQTVWQPWWGALQVVVFSDVGSWRLPGDPLREMLAEDNIQTFAGIGGRVVVNKIYNLILRADYGVDLRDFDRGGFVLGVGQYF